MHKHLNILIISDPHAHDGDPRKGDSPSHFSTNSLYSTPEKNPITSLSEVIQKAGLKVDWVVCPGDLGHQANASAQIAAWPELERIRQQVGATHLIGTTGNHDVDSRRTTPEFDPKGALQLLSPAFPIEQHWHEKSDRVYADRFWSRNYVAVPFPAYDCRLLIINSSAFHGYSSEVNGPPREHLHGRISPLTLDAIASEIKSCKNELNIALVHHHPKKYTWLEDGNSVMVNGDKLTECFKESGIQWLIIHGHQHVPNLTYADANALAPIIISAGSVAATTYAVRGVYARNQIHHVSIDCTKLAHDGSELYGIVTTWTWIDEIGWRDSAPDGGIPSKAGFGYKPSIIEIAQQLQSQVKGTNNRFLRWRDVLASQPKLKYLSPDDMKSLQHFLKSNGIAISFDANGDIVALER